MYDIYYIMSTIVQLTANEKSYFYYKIYNAIIPGTGTSKLKYIPVTTLLASYCGADDIVNKSQIFNSIGGHWYAA
ncbi:MAG: hypothetical protein NVSMB44_10770 [Ktedonobacteraceae bacterium]